MSANFRLKQFRHRFFRYNGDRFGEFGRGFRHFVRFFLTRSQFGWYQQIAQYMGFRCWQRRTPNWVLQVVEQRIAGLRVVWRHQIANDQYRPFFQSFPFGVAEPLASDVQSRQVFLK